jgi:Spy/CpxP family protein refolding chaperone
MKKEVGFNEEQTKQFKELHEKNRDSLKVIGENIRTSKNELYKLLQQANAPDSLVNRTAEQLAQNQKSMELTMFRHIQRVRAICDSQQQVKLDSVVSRMNNRSPWYRRGSSPRSEGENRKN